MGKINSVKVGILSFIIVLLFMPIGHTLMVLIEQVLHNQKFIGAGSIGFLGVALLIFGVKFNQRSTLATVLGLIAGILIWTGWVEFSFVWIAEKLQVPHLMEEGEIATKAEYLVMMSSVGLLVSAMIFFLFIKTKCQFFAWFQRIFGLQNELGTNSRKAHAVIAFFETIMIIWTFYIVLLLVYDESIAGQHHPLTYIVAFGSLFWSLYLFLNLIRIQKFDYAIKYAIPTVVIFWNFVEVLGRWDLFKEIWVHPFEHWMENTIILSLLVGFIYYYLTDNQRRKLRV